MELAACHPSGAENFVLFPRFLVNMSISVSEC
jgi:hypothetical protein